MGSAASTVGSIGGAAIGTALGGPVGGVIGGQAGGLLANSITGGGQNARMPTLQQAQLDPGAQSIMSTQDAQAMQSPQQASQNYASGLQNNVGSAGALLTGGGNTTNPMQSALDARQQRTFGANMNNQYRTNYANGPVYQFQQAQSATGNEQKEAQAAMGFANSQNQANQNNAYARNNAINSILQGGGALGGALSGGQAGAQMGSNVAGLLSTRGGNPSYLNGGQ